MTALQSALLYEATIELGAPLEVGAGPRGTRQIFSVLSGRFEGPELRGELVPAVRDWFLQRPDGVGELDVRSTLRTDDGALILAVERGVVWGPPAVMARVSAGEEVDPADYYFRTQIAYETGTERYAWLNRTLAVGLGRLTATGVRFAVHRIL